MKKIYGMLFLLAMLLILPLKANAKVELDWEEVSQDATTGLRTIAIYYNVDSGTVISEPQKIILNGEHAIIQSISGTTEWLKDETNSVLATDGLSATLALTYSGGAYVGTGEKVKIGEFSYIHDPAATASDNCVVKIGFDGGTTKTVTEKKAANPKTGSALPIVGVIAGVSLVASAYVISKRSTKLYRM